MIISLSLVNLGHHTQLQFFLVILRTFKIYPLSNFRIYNTVFLTIVTILYILMIYFITESLCTVILPASTMPDAWCMFLPSNIFLSKWRNISWPDFYRNSSNTLVNKETNKKPYLSFVQIWMKEETAGVFNMHYLAFFLHNPHLFWMARTPSKSAFSLIEDEL